MAKRRGKRTITRRVPHPSGSVRREAQTQAGWADLSEKMLRVLEEPTPEDQTLLEELFRRRFRMRRVYRATGKENLEPTGDFMKRVETSDPDFFNRCAKHIKFVTNATLLNGVGGRIDQIKIR